jgi:putative membrane protein
MVWKLLIAPHTSHRDAISRSEIMTTARHTLPWLAGSVALAIGLAAAAQTPAPSTPAGTPSTSSGPAVPAPPSGSNAPAAAGQNAPGNTGGKAAQSGTGNLSSTDRNFIMKAAEGGMAEVELGQLASQRASDPQVKQFAQRMVADHTKANDQLKKIAAAKNVQLPTDLPAAEKRQRERLSKLSGEEFDREYMSHMTSDHKKDTSLFRSAAKSARDSDVKQFASTTLPTLEEHLQMAQSIARSTKSGANKTAGKAS